MKKLLLALALLFIPAAASAQCNGVFPNNTACGNVTGSTATPRAIPLSSFPAAIPGGTNGQVQYNNAGTFGGLTNAQLTALCQQFSSTLSGCVPLSGGGTINFLRADGTWAPIPAPTVPTGVVNMTYTMGVGWSVAKPDGTLIDISASTTNGLQEAINYAATNLTRMVCNGAKGPAGGGVIFAATPVTFEATFGGYFDLNSCTIICTAAITNDDCVKVDSQEDTEIHFGYIANADANIGATIRFKPVTTLSDGQCAIFANNFYFNEIYSGQSTSAAANIVFDLNGCGNISNNKFDGTAITGLSPKAIVVLTSATQSFWGNNTHFRLVNRNNTPGGKTILVGDAIPSTNFSYGNTWTFDTIQSLVGDYGIDTYGKFDNWLVGFANVYSSNGINFRAAATNNVITVHGQFATPVVTGAGATNRFYLNGACSFNGSPC